MKPVFIVRELEVIILQMDTTDVHELLFSLQLGMCTWTHEEEEEELLCLFCLTELHEKARNIKQYVSLLHMKSVKDTKIHSTDLW